MNTIKRTTTATEGNAIALIAARYWFLLDQLGRIPTVSKITLAMDIEAVHCNGCPLRLDALLDARDAIFLQDVSGILRHIDRTTGRLGGEFVPRCAVQNAFSVPNY